MEDCSGSSMRLLHYSLSSNLMIFDDVHDVDFSLSSSNKPIFNDVALQDFISFSKDHRGSVPELLANLYPSLPPPSDPLQFDDVHDIHNVDDVADVHDVLMMFMMV
ncbi:hypothetical protein HYC85_018886 [Camellia sinensis]|uniref:Uncharacterized protein n=1 Tax=Camellia sinensis TaxID=4442 RepID=A0A7J7GVL7_CAMSI|nr:hypothetical protein HYC85_018886 [Camellia sinensis]